MGSVAAVQTFCRERDSRALLLPPVILGFHTAYGLGTLAGFVEIIGRFRPSFATRAPRQVPPNPLPQESTQH
jgi:hypothetical protein